MNTDCSLSVSHLVNMLTTNDAKLKFSTCALVRYLFVNLVVLWSSEWNSNVLFFSVGGYFDWRNICFFELTVPFIDSSSLRKSSMLNIMGRTHSSGVLPRQGKNAFSGGVSDVEMSINRFVFS